MHSYIADLHIHSPFSRATSRKSDLPGLFSWARVKGINLVGTGDFTHPGWLSHLKENLVPAEPGFFRLNDENLPHAIDGVNPEPIRVRFVLTAEISSIYKRGGKVRKVHNILMVPDFEAVEKINQRLAAIGNIESDGRPIVGLDSRDLLEILLEAAPEGFLVPAHIWTPWFSLFGSKSGFDSIEECFGDLSSYIFALETGLSSDPAMNRYISALDNYTLISNSDCHSPAKLGREVNCFSCSLDFFSMREAIKNPALGFDGTIEFFPEEGKYHLDGHRKCGVSFDPLETKAANNICPVCGNPLTIGVNHRVMDLADRNVPVFPERDPSYKSLIPLMEVISELIGIGPNSKGVLNQYSKLINQYGSEFNVLLNTPLEDLQYSLPLLDEAVRRIRMNQVICKAGFDGQFGVITVFEDGELDRLRGQGTLFNQKKSSRKKKKKLPEPILKPALASHSEQESREEELPRINEGQKQAIESRSSRILVKAGPGTGKTFTLVSRLVHLLNERQVAPQTIAAITFTNRAANEIKERLRQAAGAKGERVSVSTFHTFCLNWLRQETAITVIGEEERALLLKNLLPDLAPRERRKIGVKVSDILASSQDMIEQVADKELLKTVQEYRAMLHELGALDLDEIIPTFLNQLKENPSFKKNILASIRYLLVDEFQDVNRNQYELTELIGQQAKIFAIGDPDQAIYGFRGSDLNFFFRFADNPETEMLELQDNYRSAPPILSAAAKLITHNSLRSGVQLIPRCSGQEPIVLYRAPTVKAEAEYVVERIEELIGGISSYSINTGRSGKGESTFSFRDIAILFRLSRQANSFIEALERGGLPFQLVGSRPFFKQADIRGAYYWLLCAEGSASRAEHISLCREIPGLGANSIAQMEKAVPLKTANFFEEASKADLAPRSLSILKDLEARLGEFRRHTSTGLSERIAKACQFLGIEPDNENALRLKNLASALGTLEGLTTHLRENSQATIYDEKAESINLMTLHSAKGLEFPIVFIVGCQEGCLPHLIRDSDLEEERRLFYVGLTRSRQKLFLSSSGEQAASRFMGELPENELQRVEPRNKFSWKKKTAKQLQLFE